MPSLPTAHLVGRTNHRVCGWLSVPVPALDVKNGDGPFRLHILGVSAGVTHRFLGVSLTVGFYENRILYDQKKLYLRSAIVKQIISTKKFTPKQGNLRKYYLPSEDYTEKKNKWVLLPLDNWAT